MEQVELEKLIGELEVAVDRLRSLYDQYFMGIEKLEPTVPRKDVDRRIHVLRREQIRNTALRFRFHMLLQRYNTYQTHWQRICRDIENGTYKRHVIRAQQRFAEPASAKRVRPASETRGRPFAEELAELDREFAPAEVLSDADVELEEEGSTKPHHPPPLVRELPTPQPPSAQAPRSPPRAPRPSPQRTPRPPKPDSRPAPPSSRPPSPRAPALATARRATLAVQPAAPASSPSLAGDPPDDRVRQLYAQYIDAKRRQNESTAAITYEAVARSIRASSAKLREKLGKRVDFEVAIKDGHAIIRPVVK